MYLRFCDLLYLDYLLIFKYSMLLSKVSYSIPYNVGMIFLLPSTRTKSSFCVALGNLSCNTIPIDFSSTQISRGESAYDFFSIINGYYDLLVIRGLSDKFICNLSLSIPFINALNKNEHPTQIVNDLYTIYNIFNGFSGLIITWVGMENNVFRSLYSSSLIFGFSLRIYFNPFFFSSFYRCLNLDFFSSVLNTNIIMSDTFYSMCDSYYRYYSFGSFKVCFKYFLYSSNVFFMHCLPAYRGIEVSSDILYSSKYSIVKTQAFNKIAISMGFIYYFYRLCVN